MAWSESSLCRGYPHVVREGIAIRRWWLRHSADALAVARRAMVDWQLDKI
jgi:hypothetical protein